MTDAENKPSLDIWLRWADVLGQRLETIRQISEDHDQRESALPAAMLIIRLQNILAGALERHLAVMPYAILQQAQGEGRFDEVQIHALAGIFATALEQLPALSKNMQNTLNSPWQGQCNGRLASDLFKGPRGTLNEGIGSGLPRDGQLPQIMETLLTREKSGGPRPPRLSTLSVEDQQKWTDTARRWALRNSAHLRRAGRVE